MVEGELSEVCHMITMTYNGAAPTPKTKIEEFARLDKEICIEGNH